ncbi:MAG: PaaX family transcriptional regulator C-terminal domain-containing protein [Actinomycetota bacterium]|nr:PaaX family transcriptional regulator C-terminal domain-containing protein [Actinomycetota bacterium]
MQTIMVGVIQHRLQPQEFLLTLLGNELLRCADRQVRSTGLVSALSEHDFSPAATRSALSRLVKRGMLYPTKNGREVHYELTLRATTLLSDGEQRILSFSELNPGDEWTLLSYSLPADQRARRDRLRRRLSFLGFGGLRDGQWIAPGNRVVDTTPTLVELNLQDQVEMFVGQPASVTDVPRLIRSVWGSFTELANAYETFSRRWRNSSWVDSLGPLKARTLVMHEWRRFPHLDPGLARKHLSWGEVRAQARDDFFAVWSENAMAANIEFVALCGKHVSGTAKATT